MRDKATIKRLQMYRNFKPKRYKLWTPLGFTWLKCRDSFFMRNTDTKPTPAQAQNEDNEDMKCPIDWRPYLAQKYNHFCFPVEQRQGGKNSESCTIPKHVSFWVNGESWAQQKMVRSVNVFHVCLQSDRSHFYLLRLMREALDHTSAARIHTSFVKTSGNTRVVTQSALQTFQDEMGKVIKDPYKVVMRQTKLPITLLNETAKVSLFWKCHPERMLSKIRTRSNSLTKPNSSTHHT